MALVRPLTAPVEAATALRQAAALSMAQPSVQAEVQRVVQRVEAARLVQVVRAAHSCHEAPAFRVAHVAVRQAQVGGLGKLLAAQAQSLQVVPAARDDHLCRVARVVHAPVALQQAQSARPSMQRPVPQAVVPLAALWGQVAPSIHPCHVVRIFRVALEAMRQAQLAPLAAAMADLRSVDQAAATFAQPALRVVWAQQPVQPAALCDHPICRACHPPCRRVQRLAVARSGLRSVSVRRP